jgi:hypothetical protein
VRPPVGDLQKAAGQEDCVGKLVSRVLDIKPMLPSLVMPLARTFAFSWRSIWKPVSQIVTASNAPVDFNAGIKAGSLQTSD